MNAPEGGNDRRIAGGHALHGDALVVVQQVRRGIGTTTQAERRGGGIEEGDRRALAVGPADRDHPRRRTRGTEPVPDPGDPFQAQVDVCGWAAAIRVSHSPVPDSLACSR